MIENYDSSAVYTVYETKQDGKTSKIGEIQNFVFYDLNTSGKRVMPGFSFTNTQAFWNQFESITIKKVDRPLYGYEGLVWGTYWTIQILLTLFVLVYFPPESKIFYLIFSAITFALSVKYRYNKYVIYWMIITSIIFVLILISIKVNKQK
jgi:hypothetical protein